MGGRKRVRKQGGQRWEERRHGHRVTHQLGLRLGADVGLVFVITGGRDDHALVGGRRPGLAIHTVAIAAASGIEFSLLQFEISE